MDYFDLFSRHVQKLTQHQRGELRGQCPLHDDKNPSWSGNQETGLWKCHGCGSHGNARQFAERVGERWNEPHQPRHEKPYNPWRDRRVEAEYDYTDANGNLLYQSVRFEPKDFRQRKPDGKGGWDYSLNGTQRVLYRLPELAAAQVVYIVEGEKDTETLRTTGRVATTIAGGVNGPLDARMLQPLRDKHVVIIPDNDESGREFASRVFSLVKDLARTVRHVELPQIPHKEDVSWWLANGHTPEELAALVKATPITGGKRQWRPILKRFSDITEKKVEWLFYPYIPRGRVTFLDGDPGQGKSWFSLAVATSVTYGGWPVHTDGVENLGTPSDVIYVTCEDDPEDTIKKRLRVLQTDQQRMHYLSGKRRDTDTGEMILTFTDLDVFAEALEETQAKLLIIDPIQAYWPSGSEMNRAEQVRPVMMSLQKLAHTHDCAMLLVRHLNKGNGGKALYRGMSSIDFAAAARSVLVCAERKELSTEQGVTFQRRFGVAQSKNNIAPKGKTLEFELQFDQFLWIGTCDVTADELLTPSEALAHSSTHEVEEAKRFLVHELAQGAQPVDVLGKKARGVWIKPEALLAARAAMGIMIQQEEEQWVWALQESGRYRRDH